MSDTLARLYNFSSGQPVRATEFNNELNQLINLLAGISTNKRINLVFNDGTLPVARFNQLGAGSIVEYQKAGSLVSYFNNSGQFVSNVPIGTPPFILQSNTKVANLNCDLIDGLEGALLLRNDTAGQYVQSNLRIKRATTGTMDIIFEQDNNICTVSAIDDNNNKTTLFTISAMDQATRIISIPATTRLQAANAASNAADVVRKNEYDARTNTFSANLYSNNPSFTTSNGYFYVAPNSNITVLKLKAAYYSGTVTANSRFDLYLNNGSTTTLQNSITLLSGTAVNTTLSVTLGTPLVLTEDWALIWVRFSDGGHRDVCLAVTGNE